jgi:hypothetical protein
MTAPPASSVEPDESNAAEHDEPARPVAGRSLGNLTGIEQVRASCHSFQLFGAAAGCGLAVLGMLLGALRLVGASEGGPLQGQGWARASIEAAIVLLAFVLAGWAVAGLSRLMTAAILERLERANDTADRFAVQVVEAVALLERMTVAMENGGRPAVSRPAPALDRARAMAEVVRATSAADWDDATARLNEFETDFPDDPDVPTLKKELADAREKRARDRLAELDAARTVNDTDRVFEIYQDLATALSEEQRSSLEQDLAKWFLSLIHRRLRTGRVQPDVVQLATRFAEDFATTVEGASVRASLPTLRRSVGLCPRCAQPYIGVADACPACLKGAPQTLSTFLEGADGDGFEDGSEDELKY